MIAHRTVDEVAFLQVGQGDATLLSRNGSHLLIDAGPRSNTLDGGQRFVWPELHRRGIRRLDAIFITHFDRDHYGGLQALLGRIQVDRIVVVAPNGIEDENLKLLREIGMRSDQLVVLESEQRLDFGGLTVDVVPGESGLGADDNSQSPYLGVDYGADRIIFTGDAPGDLEKYWLSLGVKPGHIVKAGHHGSEQSLSSEWLEAMQPNFVVFSCGRNNPWHHPSPGALGRVREVGAKSLRTDALGTVRFKPDSQGRLQLVSAEDRPAILEFFQR